MNVTSSTSFSKITLFVVGFAIIDLSAPLAAAQALAAYTVALVLLDHLFEECHICD